MLLIPVVAVNSMQVLFRAVGVVEDLSIGSKDD